MTDTLPPFRYHPDPVATGAFEQRPTVCRCCGQARGWSYVVAPYAVEQLWDALCPWCIADGSAARRFDAVYTDLTRPGTVPSGTPAEVVKVIATRTPGFSGWQDERWLFHCGDGAAFLGPAGWDELVELPEVVEDLCGQLVADGMDLDDAEIIVGSLDVDGSSTAYLFRCLHCGVHLAYADHDRG